MTRNKSLDSETTIKPGQRIAGRYRVQRLIGHGGMGIVFLAKHEAVGQLVALKVLNESAAGDEANVQRFLKEARASARIRGEHVAKVFDVGRLPNRTPYIAMEYLRGEDLAQRLERLGPLPPPEVCRYLLDAIHALAQAHAMGIVHRDLKPPNLFLEEQPAHPPVLKVLDFGIAKMDEGESTSGVTSTGTIMGTPAYMAPEQMRSTRSVDARADVWALGVIAYELMSGQLPYPGESLGDILVAVIENRSSPLNQIAPRVPVGLSDVVARCLMREPALRYPDVTALAEALEPFAGAEGAAKVQTIRLLATGAGSAEDPFGELPSTGATSSDLPTVAAPWSLTGMRARDTRRRDAIVTVGAGIGFVLIGLAAARSWQPSSRALAATDTTVATESATSGHASESSAGPVQAASAPLASVDGGAALPTAAVAADAGEPPTRALERATPRRRGRADATPRAAAASPGYTDDPSWGGLPGKH